MGKSKLHRKISLACEEMPVPVVDPETGLLGGVKTDLEINSRLGLEEAIGRLHRNSPPPSMSHTFLELVKAASESIDSPGSAPIIAMIGPQGTGKTTAAEEAFYLVDGEPPEVFDCGNRSADELLWEPVIADSSQSLVHRLEEKFNTGKVSDINKAFLRREIKEALVRDEETGREHLDFSLVGPEKVTRAIEVLQTLVQLEGISSVSGIEINYVKGPLIRKWEEAVEAQNAGEFKPCRILIDEWDKRKRDTGKSLQQFWLVAQGLRESHTVRKNNMEFTFRHSEIPKGFSITITGNDARDLTGGGESTGFNTSQASRLTILHINQSTEEDLTYRICQALTGVPFLSLELHNSSKREKAEYLKAVRLLGKEEPLGEEEEWMIDNYEKTLAAAKKLAAFYKTWAETLEITEDEEEEVTSAFKEPPDVRMAHKHIAIAKRGDVLRIDFDKAKPSLNPIKALLAQKKSETPEKRSIGSRLTSVIRQAIHKRTASKVLRTKLEEAAKLHGILEDFDEEKNQNKNRESIASLLDNKEQEFKIEPETLALQTNLYNELTRVHKDKFMGNIPQPEELLPTRDLQAALNQCRNAKSLQTTESTTYILNINPNYITGNAKEKPIECIPIICPSLNTHMKHLKDMGKKKAHEAMMTTSTFMATLKTPKIGVETIDGLWNQAWRKEITDRLENLGIINTGEEIPEVGQIIGGNHQTLRAAKVMTMGDKGKTEISLIFHNPTTATTWLLTEKTTLQEIKLQMPDGRETGETLLTYSHKDIPRLLRDLRKEIPSSTLADMEHSLTAFHNLPILPTDEEIHSPKDPEKKTEALMKAALRERRLNNVKIPIRISSEHITNLG